MRFSALFSPAAHLMNRLRYPQKFLLVGLILLIPSLLLMRQYLLSVRGDLEFNTRELSGLAYNEPVIDLLERVLQHGALVGVALTGAGSLADAINSIERDIDALIAEVDQVDAEYGQLLQTTPTWNNIKAMWNSLRTIETVLDVGASNDSHAALTNQILILLTISGNNSNLVLDPQIDSYYLMDTLVHKIPTVSAYLNELRMYGSQAVMRGEVLAADRTRLGVLTGVVRSIGEANHLGLDFAFNYNASLRQRIEADAHLYFDTLQTFLTSIETRIRQTDSAQANSQVVALGGFFGEIEELLDISFGFYAIVHDELSNIINARISRIENQRNLVLTVAFSAILLAVFLFSGFYLSVRRTISKLEQASSQMVSGKLDSVVVLDNRDELAQVVKAFNTVARELVDARDQALETNRLKDEFLATMSHELRTPLNSIIGYTGIMRSGMRGHIDDEANTMLMKVESSSEHLLNLINDILEIAKMNAGKLDIVNEPIKVRALVASWVNQMEVFANQKHLAMDVQVAPDMPDDIFGDAHRLTQIAMNLLSNAIKFTQLGHVGLHVTRANGEWVLSFSDTGIGIPENALDYIFDEFRQVDGSYQRSQGGTGLGLAIVRKLCIRMGGTVTVKSEIGVGSTFTVKLPLRVVPTTAQGMRSVEYAT